MLVYYWENRSSGEIPSRTKRMGITTNLEHETHEMTMTLIEFVKIRWYSRETIISR